MSSFNSLELAKSAVIECGGGEIWAYDNIDGTTSYKFIYPESHGGIPEAAQCNEMHASPFVRNPRKINC